MRRHAGAGREARPHAYDADRRAAQTARRCRCTGYRTDSERHSQARMKLSRARRRAIARAAALARWR